MATQRLTTWMEMQMPLARDKRPLSRDHSSFGSGSFFGRIVVSLGALFALVCASNSFASDVHVLPSETSTGQDGQKYLTYGSKWPNGFIRWVYNDTFRSYLISPSSADTLGRIQTAMNKWSAVCGVRFDYGGSTQTWPGYGQGGINVFGWEVLSGTTGGVTHLQMNASSGTIVQADVSVNLNFNPFFDVVLLHEIGHMIGLRHSNVEGAVMSGGPNEAPYPSTAYTQLTQLQADDIAGCRAIYGGPTAGAQADLVVTSVSAGTYLLGSGQRLASQTTVIRNNGSATAAAGAEVRLYWSTRSTLLGASTYSGWSCTLRSLAPGETEACQGPVDGPGQSGIYWFGAIVNENRAATESDYANNSGVDPQAVTVGGAASSPAQMVEYYHSTLDYYFITSRPNEILLLDGTPAFRRTGQSFSVHASPVGLAVGIRRYYFDRVALGGTRGGHFYTAVATEQQALASLNPLNTPAPRLPYDEGIDSYAFAPIVDGIGGFCGSGQVPIYRVFRGNARFPDNPNHRFTTSVATYSAFLALGWDGEGVKLCAPAL
jgi:hypothetical protein